MTSDLSLAQNYAVQLARTLMVPVTLFRSGSEFGVFPSAEPEDDEIKTLTGYDPYTGAKPVH